MRKLLACLALAVATPLGAQSRFEDLGAFYALIYTPVGALPSIAKVRTPQDSGSHGFVDVRYGRYKFRNANRGFNNIGITGQWKVLRSVRLGGTWAHRSCGAGCSGLTMWSMDAGATLLHHKAREYGAGDTELGVELSAGFGSPSDEDFSTQSFSLVMPMTVTLPQANDAVLALSLLPGAGYGRLTDDAGIIFSTQDTSGAIVPGPTGDFGTTRLLIGASIGYLFPVGLGVYASVHRIAIEESTTQSGVVVSWRF